MGAGKILSIHITPDGGGLPAPVEAVRAVAGKGLEGDRYFLRTGTYSKKPNESREVTFIESEALEALRRDYGLELSAADLGDLPALRLARPDLVDRRVLLNVPVGYL